MGHCDQPASFKNAPNSLIDAASPDDTPQLLARWIGPDNAAGFGIPTGREVSKPKLGSGALLFDLKQRSRKFRLPNDAQQRAASDRIVERNRNGYCRCLQTFLHDPMAAPLADRGESVLFENPANLRARKNSELTQPAPQPESRKLRCESAGRLRTGRPFRRTA